MPGVRRGCQRTNAAARRPSIHRRIGWPKRIGVAMVKKITKRRRPNISICKSDYERLTKLVLAAAAHLSDNAEALRLKLDQGHIVADGWAGQSTVQMGSTVRYIADRGDPRTIKLVFPGDADISEGKVSVLAPVGTALLGLSAGQSVTWTARDGREHELTVLSVVQAPRAASARPASDPRHPTAAGA